MTDVKAQNFKNVYVVDMKKVQDNIAFWFALGDRLPIFTKNGINSDDNYFVGNLSERFVKKMIKQYNILSDALGSTDASTIIEYLDNSNKPVLTLYPTNDVDVHNHDWTHVSQSAITDLQKVHDERVALLNKFQNSVRPR